jgi:hypothetical protein
MLQFWTINQAWESRKEEIEGNFRPGLWVGLPVAGDDGTTAWWSFLSSPIHLQLRIFTMNWWKSLQHSTCAVKRLWDEHGYSWRICHRDGDIRTLFMVLHAGYRPDDTSIWVRYGKIFSVIYRNAVWRITNLRFQKVQSKTHFQDNVLWHMGRFYNNRGMSVNILTATNTGNNRRTAVSMRRPVNTPAP